jgi:hypothetical protein
MNRMKNNKKRKKRSSSDYRTQQVARSLTGVIAGTFLTRENVVRQLPFLIFIMVLAMIYIGNSYSAEKLDMTIERIKKENDVLRYEHVLTKSRLTNYSRPPEVARKLQGTGIKESVLPPQKIYANKK